MTAGVRLQKVLAGAGVASRRVCEDLITAGRVSVNGEVVRELGTRVDPTRDVLHVDGLRVQLDTSLVTLALNKPVQVVSTMSDPQGRRSLGDLVADIPERLYHVGRLDFETDGLILLSNDGELAHRLAHPSYEVAKTYVARVGGSVAPRVRRDLLAGVELSDGLVRADSFTVLERRTDASVVEVVLHSGRNRVVRRMLAEVGHPVQRLTRTSFGSVRLGQLRPGQHRVLTGSELSHLMREVGL